MNLPPPPSRTDPSLFAQVGTASVSGASACLTAYRLDPTSFAATPFLPPSCVSSPLCGVAGHTCPKGGNASMWGAISPQEANSCNNNQMMATPPCAQHEGPTTGIKDFTSFALPGGIHAVGTHNARPMPHVPIPTIETLRQSQSQQYHLTPSCTLGSLATDYTSNNKSQQILNNAYSSASSPLLSAALVGSYTAALRSMTNSLTNDGSVNEWRAEDGGVASPFTTGSDTYSTHRHTTFINNVQHMDQQLQQLEQHQQQQHHASLDLDTAAARLSAAMGCRHIESQGGGGLALQAIRPSDLTLPHLADCGAAAGLALGTNLSSLRDASVLIGGSNSIITPQENLRLRINLANVHSPNNYGNITPSSHILQATGHHHIIHPTCRITVGALSTPAPLLGTTPHTALPCVNFSTTVPLLEKEKEICKDYLAGRCQRANCRYLHLPPNTRPTPQEICKDFARGACQRTVCRYFHGTLSELNALKSSPALSGDSFDTQLLNGSSEGSTKSDSCTAPKSAFPLSESSFRLTVHQSVQAGLPLCSERETQTTPRLLDQLPWSRQNKAVKSVSTDTSELN